MRSSRSVLAVVVALAFAGCGETFEPTPIEDPDVCETTFLSYSNFGEPFVLDWCRGCHSSQLGTLALRQDAPMSVDFDTLDDVRTHAPRMLVRATAQTAAPTMPPAAGPSAQERALLAEWLTCGAP